MKREGLEVRNDYILDAMRWFKRNVTKDVKGHRIIVCKECYPKYAESRKRFISRQMLYVGIGVAFFALGLLFPPSISIGSLVFGIFVILFLYLLSLLNYIPDLKVNTQQKKQ